MNEPTSLRQFLQTRYLGRAHRHLSVVASTNDEAAKWLRSGAPHGALVTADWQSAGRGRLGRSWQAAPGDALLVSLALRPGAGSQEFGALGLAVAVGLRQGLIASAAVDPELLQIKWPNDLLLDERKVAGILCECRWQDHGPEVVVGFGLNVFTQDFPDELQNIATSLWRSGKLDPLADRWQLLAHLLAGLEDALSTFFAGGFAAIRDDYEPYCRELGRPIRLSQVPSQLSHVAGPLWARALADDGALMVSEGPHGPLVRVQSADVWLAAPDATSRRGPLL